jgi:hypothetical protein
MANVSLKMDKVDKMLYLRHFKAKLGNN